MQNIFSRFLKTGKPPESTAEKSAALLEARNVILTSNPQLQASMPLPVIEKKIAQIHESAARADRAEAVSEAANHALGVGPVAMSQVQYEHLRAEHEKAREKTKHFDDLEAAKADRPAWGSPEFEIQKKAKLAKAKSDLAAKRAALEQRTIARKAARAPVAAPAPAAPVAHALHPDIALADKLEGLWAAYHAGDRAEQNKIFRENRALMMNTSKTRRRAEQAELNQRGKL